MVEWIRTAECVVIVESRGSAAHPIRVLPSWEPWVSRAHADMDFLRDGSGYKRNVGLGCLPG